MDGGVREDDRGKEGEGMHTQGGAKSLVVGRRTLDHLRPKMRVVVDILFQLRYAHLVSIHFA